MDETPPFIGFLSPHMRRTPSLQKDAEGACATSVDAGGASAPSPNRPVRATPSPKRMPMAHAQHQWTLGAHQTPLPPQQTGTSNPFPQKDAESACATWVDAGGASAPSPKRPVRATPSPTDRYEQPRPPKRMLSAHAQHQWTLGAHQTPFPQETGTSNPFPLPPPLYKGVTDRAQT